MNKESESEYLIGRPAYNYYDPELVQCFHRRVTDNHWQMPRELFWDQISFSLVLPVA